MITGYWLLEYAKVLFAYLFVMFIWPSVVFRGVFKGKSLTFRFSFCVAGQILLFNTVVLLLGLLHILKPWIFCGLFYGVFLFSICRGIKFEEREKRALRHLFTGTYGKKLFFLRLWEKMKGSLLAGWRCFRRTLGGHVLEYGLLAVLLVYAMIYFSHGAFQDYSFGSGDLYVHNAWIYGLTEGQVFSAGVYPEGMHCFVYGLHTLFGIKIYSCLLFLGGIHVTAFLVSAYILMKEIFCWRFTALWVLTAFLTVDVLCVDEIFSMSRLQWTLPQEFGLFTIFACAAFLVRYLKNAGQRQWRGKSTRFCWDENLLLFLMSLAASLAIHFYPTIMAFFLCVCFVPVFWHKIFRPRYFVPLLSAVICGFLIAVIPMGGALASGIPFQGSIGWAMSVINGEEENAQEEASELSPEEAGEALDGQTGGESMEGGIAQGESAQGQSALGQSALGQMAEEQTQTGKEAESLSEKLESLGNALWEKLWTVYQKGYVTLYREQRAQWIAGATALAVLLWAVCRIILLFVRLIRRKRPAEKSFFDGYLAIALASVLYMTMYCASSVGLPQLVEGARLCSTEQLLILAVMGIGPDVLFMLTKPFVPQLILNPASVLLAGAIYVGTMLTGSFHGYLYYELTRYNGAVLATCSIVNALPEETYTIVSPTEELYQVIQYGWHEELIDFVNKSRTKEYTLPTEYVFLYVEKRPIQSSQSHFFTGPRWLAWEKYPAYFPSNVSQCPQILSASLTGEERAQDRVFVSHSSTYSDLESRTLVEEAAMEWCEEFDRLYPGELKLYYEDESIVCYYFRQNVQSLYQLGILYQEDAG